MTLQSAWRRCSTVLLLGLALLPACVPAAAAQAPDLRIDAAEFVVGDAPEAPSSGWQPRALPDNWARSNPGLNGFSWYRMRFHFDAVPAAALALYAQRAVYAPTESWPAVPTEH